MFSRRLLSAIQPRCPNLAHLGAVSAFDLPKSQPPNRIPGVISPLPCPPERIILPSQQHHSSRSEIGVGVLCRTGFAGHTSDRWGVPRLRWRLAMKKFETILIRSFTLLNLVLVLSVLEGSAAGFEKTVSAGSGKIVNAGSGKVMPAGRGRGYWRTYGLQDGLSGGHITSILQDSEE